jgi:hypothetical protein
MSSRNTFTDISIINNLSAIWATLSLVKFTYKIGYNTIQIGKLISVRVGFEQDFCNFRAVFSSRAENKRFYKTAHFPGLKN